MPKPKIGRPTRYSNQIADEILDRMCSGETLTSICQSEHLPSRTTVWQWYVDDRRGFSNRYARARVAQAAYYVDEILVIADDVSEDVVMDTVGFDESGDPIQVERVNREHIQRSKIRIESRKWLAKVLDPASYGDKQRLEHTGADGGPVEQFVDSPQRETPEAWLIRVEREAVETDDSE